MKTLYTSLEKKLGVNFKDKNLLIKSLTHKSFNNQNNNEKIEFLGDRVLGLVIAKKLLEIYPEEKEGILDKKYASLVLKGKYPKSIQEIPFLPISFFKSEKIISKNLDAEIIFKSSGTEGKRSSHYVSSVNLYEKSFLKNFIANYGDLEKKCIIGLLPSYLENGDSSLIYLSLIHI